MDKGYFHYNFINWFPFYDDKMEKIILMNPNLSNRDSYEKELNDNVNSFNTYSQLMEAPLEGVLPKNNSRQRKKRISKNYNIQCSLCNVKETPLWRHSPFDGKKLCNACGLKERKRFKQIKKD